MVSEPDEQDRLAAQWLHRQLGAIAPGQDLLEVSLDQWAVDFARLRANRQVDHEAIHGVIAFALAGADDFWRVRAPIRSPAALDRHWPTLIAQSNAPKRRRKGR